MKRMAGLIFGLIALFLGTLWLLQGLGIVQLRPILCFADCTPVQGLSVTWAATGLIALVVGAGCVLWSRKLVNT